MLGFWGIFQQNPPSIPKYRVDSFVKKRVPRRRDHLSDPMASFRILLFWNPSYPNFQKHQHLVTSFFLHSFFFPAKKNIVCFFPKVFLQSSFEPPRCVFTGPLQGFLNALVYGSTPAVRDAITGRFDHGAAKLKGLKSQLRMLRRKRKNFQQFQEGTDLLGDWLHDYNIYIYK